LHSLQAIVARARAVFDSARFAALTGPEGPYGVAISLLSAQRPAEIVNYRSTGAMPVLLAGALAAGALAGLALTLLAFCLPCCTSWWDGPDRRVLLRSRRSW
jgi:hypothetical protein